MHGADASEPASATAASATAASGIAASATARPPSQRRPPQRRAPSSGTAASGTAVGIPASAPPSAVAASAPASKVAASASLSVPPSKVPASLATNASAPASLPASRGSATGSCTRGQHHDQAHAHAHPNLFDARSRSTCPRPHGRSGRSCRRTTPASALAALPSNTESDHLSTMPGQGSTDRATRRSMILASSAALDVRGESRDAHRGARWSLAVARADEAMLSIVEEGTARSGAPPAHDVHEVGYDSRGGHLDVRGGSRDRYGRAIGVEIGCAPPQEMQSIFEEARARDWRREPARPCCDLPRRTSSHPSQRFVAKPHRPSTRDSASLLLEIPLVFLVVVP